MQSERLKVISNDKVGRFHTIIAKALSNLGRYVAPISDNSFEGNRLNLYKFVLSIKPIVNDLYFLIWERRSGRGSYGNGVKLFLEPLIYIAFNGASKLVLAIFKRSLIRHVRLRKLVKCFFMLYTYIYIFIRMRYDL